MSEVPFPADPPGFLGEGRGGNLYLYFRDPALGGIFSVRVDPQGNYFDPKTKENVWTYRRESEWVVISPSIHAVSRFHTGNPVRFREVSSKDEL